jgi:hypothetical protein
MKQRIAIPDELLTRLYVRGDSLRRIAQELKGRRGIVVSHETIKTRLRLLGLYGSRKLDKAAQKAGHRASRAHLGRKAKAFRACELCDERAYANNRFCQKHQRRFVRHGDPLMVRGERETPRR